jgi:hypothetical protein
MAADQQSTSERGSSRISLEQNQIRTIKYRKGLRDREPEPGLPSLDQFNAMRRRNRSVDCNASALIHR